MALALVPAVTEARSDADVLQAQSRLLELGFDPGPVDGIHGPRTRAALLAFQRARGLAPSGELDHPTREALGLVAGAGPPRAPAPPPERDAAAAPPPDAPPPPAAAPAPPAAEPRFISFEALGWHPPQSARGVLARHGARTDRSPEMTRDTGELVVPGPDLVYVLRRGERIPELQCDPRAGRVTIDPVFGRDGPIVFASVGNVGVCRLGFGIVLAVGTRVELVGSGWLDARLPQGPGRIREDGIELTSR